MYVMEKQKHVEDMNGDTNRIIFTENKHYGQRYFIKMG